MMFVGSSRSSNPTTSGQDSPRVDDGSGIGFYSSHDVNAEIIDINVAGKKFQTYRKTLSRFPNSLLGNVLRRNKFLNPKTGELFFDRHRASFESILHYYQSGVMARPTNVPVHIFIEELIFFDVGKDVIEKLQIEHGLKELEVEKVVPKLEVFRIMWHFLEEPTSSRAAKLFAVCSILVIVFSLVLFVIETLPEFQDEQILINGTAVVIPGVHSGWMFSGNTAVIAWFSFEFFARFICSPTKLKFFFEASNVIDFLSVLPFYLSIVLSKSRGSLSVLRVVRVIRVLRVFKLYRHSRGLKILGNTLKASFEELMMLAFFLGVMILIFGSCVYYAEYTRENTEFTSIPKAFWWAIVTMATVGYGDMVPETLAGKLIGSMAVMCGVLTIALPVPVVVSNFEYFYGRERNRMKTEQARREQEKQKDLISQRDRVNKNLSFIRHQLGRLKSIQRKTTLPKVEEETSAEPYWKTSNGSACHQPESPSTSSTEAKAISSV